MKIRFVKPVLLLNVVESIWSLSLSIFSLESDVN